MFPEMKLMCHEKQTFSSTAWCNGLQHALELPFGFINGQVYWLEKKNLSGFCQKLEYLKTDFGSLNLSSAMAERVSHALKLMGFLLKQECVSSPGGNGLVTPHSTEKHPMDCSSVNVIASALGLIPLKGRTPWNGQQKYQLLLHTLVKVWGQRNLDWYRKD